jgi:hypothetical protein
MFGEPKDIKGNCNARLYIADDYGDGHATMLCELKLGHPGPHKETFRDTPHGPAVLTWSHDERWSQVFRNVEYILRWPIYQRRKRRITWNVNMIGGCR